MRTSSNPVFRNLPKQEGVGGYATFGSGAAATGQATQQYGQYGQDHGQQYQPYQTPQTRAMTIDDVVTKTGITLAVLSRRRRRLLLPGRENTRAGRRRSSSAAASVGLVLVLIATFGRKQDNPAIVLTYAALEGLFLGALSFMLANFEFRRQGGAT